MKKISKVFKRSLIILFLALCIIILDFDIKPMKPSIMNDPEKVAIVYLSEKLTDFVYETKVENQRNGVAIVRFIDNNEKIAAKVGLSKNQDKQWEIQWENIYEP